MSRYSHSVIGDDMYSMGRGHNYHDSSFDPLVLLDEARNHMDGGMSRHRSQSWHNQVYGGMGDTAKLLATEIGAAAGFEAWLRHNRKHGHIIDPDREHMLRLLVAAAAYEVEKHWSHSGRHEDSHGKKEAMLTAAVIAMKLFHKGDHGLHHSRRPGFFHRRSSSVPPYSHGHRRDYSPYSDFGRDYDDYDSDYGLRGRSPHGYGHHEPSLLESTLPAAALALEGSHHHGRSHSHHSRPLEYMMDDLALGSSRHSHGHGYDRDYDYDYDYPSSSHGYYPSSSHHGHHRLGGLFGRGHRHGHHGHHSSTYGLPVQREIHGDPYSEFGHLPPGTYVVEGGSRRRRHSGGLRGLISNGSVY